MRARIAAIGGRIDREIRENDVSAYTQVSPVGSVCHVFVKSGPIASPAAALLAGIFFPEKGLKYETLWSLGCCGSRARRGDDVQRYYRRVSFPAPCGLPASCDLGAPAALTSANPAAAALARRSGTGTRRFVSYPNKHFLW